MPIIVKKSWNFNLLSIFSQHITNNNVPVLYEHLPVRWNTDLNPRPNLPTFNGSFSLQLIPSEMIPFQSELVNSASLYANKAGP